MSSIQKFLELWAREYSSKKGKSANCTHLLCASKQLVESLPAVELQLVMAQGADSRIAMIADSVRHLDTDLLSNGSDSLSCKNDEIQVGEQGAISLSVLFAGIVQTHPEVKELFSFSQATDDDTPPLPMRCSDPFTCKPLRAWIRLAILAASVPGSSSGSLRDSSLLEINRLVDRIEQHTTVLELFHGNAEVATSSCRLVVLHLFSAFCGKYLLKEPMTSALANASVFHLFKHLKRNNGCSPPRLALDDSPLLLEDSLVWWLRCSEFTLPSKNFPSLVSRNIREDTSSSTQGKDDRSVNSELFLEILAKGVERRHLATLSEEFRRKFLNHIHSRISFILLEIEQRRSFVERRVVPNLQVELQVCLSLLKEDWPNRRKPWPKDAASTSTSNSKAIEGALASIDEKSGMLTTCWCSPLLFPLVERNGGGGTSKKANLKAPSSVPHSRRFVRTFSSSNELEEWYESRLEEATYLSFNSARQWFSICFDIAPPSAKRVVLDALLKAAELLHHPTLSLRFQLDLLSCDALSFEDGAKLKVRKRISSTLNSFGKDLSRLTTLIQDRGLFDSLQQEAKIFAPGLGLTSETLYFMFALSPQPNTLLQSCVIAPVEKESHLLPWTVAKAVEEGSLQHWNCNRRSSSPTSSGPTPELDTFHLNVLASFVLAELKSLSLPSESEESATKRNSNKKGKKQASNAVSRKTLCILITLLIQNYRKVLISNDFTPSVISRFKSEILFEFLDLWASGQRAATLIEAFQKAKKLVLNNGDTSRNLIQAIAGTVFRPDSKTTNSTQKLLEAALGDLIISESAGDVAKVECVLGWMARGDLYPNCRSFLLQKQLRDITICCVQKEIDSESHSVPQMLDRYYSLAEGSLEADIFSPSIEIMAVALKTIQKICSVSTLVPNVALITSKISHAQNTRKTEIGKLLLEVNWFLTQLGLTSKQKQVLETLKSSSDFWLHTQFVAWVDSDEIGEDLQTLLKTFPPSPAFLQKQQRVVEEKKRQELEKQRKIEENLAHEEARLQEQREIQEAARIKQVEEQQKRREHQLAIERKELDQKREEELRRSEAERKQKQEQKAKIEELHKTAQQAATRTKQKMDQSSKVEGALTQSLHRAGLPNHEVIRLVRAATGRWHETGGGSSPTYPSFAEVLEFYVSGQWDPHPDCQKVRRLLEGEKNDEDESREISEGDPEPTASKGMFWDELEAEPESSDEDSPLSKLPRDLVNFTFHEKCVLVLDNFHFGKALPDYEMSESDSERDDEELVLLRRSELRDSGVPIGVLRSTIPLELLKAFGWRDILEVVERLVEIGLLKWTHCSRNFLQITRLGEIFHQPFADPERSFGSQRMQAARRVRRRLRQQRRQERREEFLATRITLPEVKNTAAVGKAQLSDDDLWNTMNMDEVMMVLETSKVDEGKEEGKRRRKRRYRVKEESDDENESPEKKKRRKGLKATPKLSVLETAAVNWSALRKRGTKVLSIKDLVVRATNRFGKYCLVAAMVVLFSFLLIEEVTSKGTRSKTKV